MPCPDHIADQNTAPAAVTGWKRVLWLLLAYLSLGVGVVAIFIPGIPTTEFILLAAWAASRGSPRLQRWLENHRLFGAMIRNWRHGRVVARRAKLGASFTMGICLLIMLVMVERRWIVVLAAVGMALGAGWMWSRPEQVMLPRPPPPPKPAQPPPPTPPHQSPSA